MVETRYDRRLYLIPFFLRVVDHVIAGFMYKMNFLLGIKKMCNKNMRVARKYNQLLPTIHSQALPSPSCLLVL